VWSTGNTIEKWAEISTDVPIRGNVALLQSSIARLAIAGERAGFSVEQMIQMLNAGVTVERLLRIIEWRLAPIVEEPRSSRWIM